jgi:ABC-type glycerol-3-phosphate transport system permease component
VKGSDFKPELKRRFKKPSLTGMLAFSFMLLFTVFCVLPLFYVVMTSFQTTADIASPTGIIPNTLSIESYSILFQGDFLHFLRNSVVVSVAVTFLNIVLGSAAAFGIARLNIGRKETILYLFLAVSIVPTVAVVGPLFLVLRKIGLLNTTLGLGLCYIGFSLPLTIWIVTNQMRRIPPDLEEAARIDGCGHLRTFSNVTFPLAAPAVATAGILCFIYCWSEFFIALVATLDSRSRTLPVGIALLGSRYEIPWGHICAATVIAIIPLVLVALFLQRRIASGLLAGAFK